ncbi:2Fe-2S iron-sulfur cluster-binding protein [Neorhizobium sp. S3-V5DH]|uniref:2Fe-2S iron-sulfur cluster-binding protein n=1 Tax=Neorhizobium sp. S3-V5DH TaxID=2485166 RepID=UPI0010494105|nr:2Fe-2S iron-sulfur cluster-binding protein [Neorhizobium sp. S3-V5DH]TCV69305.1 2Fe-2S ferredoxin [Neorhizobium sp. S3-V5DH]
MNATHAQATDSRAQSGHIRVKDREGAYHDVEWQQGQSLMEALRDHGLPVLASCGGVAACATCHVHLDPEIATKLGERSEDEEELLEGSDAFDPDRSRLSCQVLDLSVLGEAEVELAPEDS